jgi:hypothetical protein
MFHILKRNSSFLFCASGWTIEDIQHCITDVVDGDGLDIASLLGRGPWHFEIKVFLRVGPTTSAGQKRVPFQMIIPIRCFTCNKVEHFGKI